MVICTAHTTAATLTDNSVGAAMVGTVDAVVAPTEETCVEAEDEEERTEETELLPEETAAIQQLQSVRSARAPQTYQSTGWATCRTETGARSVSQAEALANNVGATLADHTTCLVLVLTTGSPPVVATSDDGRN